MKQRLLIIFLFVSIYSTAQPLPTKYQLAWHEQEFYLFVHFGPNSFTGREWGEGTEPESIFNPQKLDCRQWCRIAKQAGAKGIIITAKHHDGFCLWPSKYSSHTVRETRWKNGKADVLKELSDACREAGIKFGVYISPWDRNHPDYGTEKYNDVFINMMKEIFTNYGPVWELWWDGANGEGPNGKKQVYDWVRFEKTVRQLSPSTVIFSDIGPDIRWVGNEQGIAGDPNWNFLDTAGFKRGLGAPPTDTLNHGNYNGHQWIPGECDVSIRPGWFWHSNEDDKIKTPGKLFTLYLNSVGHGANLLLNVPPDSNGLITKKDSFALMEFRKLRDQSFGKNLVGKISKQADQHLLNAKLNSKTEINCIILKENIKQGQSIRRYKIELFDGKNRVGEIGGTSIGRKKIICFPVKKISSFRVTVTPGSVSLVISTEAYSINENLIEK